MSFSKGRKYGPDAPEGRAAGTWFSAAGSRERKAQPLRRSAGNLLPARPRKRGDAVQIFGDYVPIDHDRLRGGDRSSIGDVGATHREGAVAIEAVSAM